MATTRREGTLAARLVRLAALVAFVFLVALLLGTAVERASGATISVSSVAAPSSEEELAEEREEEELEAPEEEHPDGELLTEELGGTDCELAQEGLEEGLLTPIDVEDLCTAEEEWLAELEGHGSKARSRCVLRSAKARVATGGKRLTLTFGYTTREPTKARIEIRAGNRRLGTVRRRLSHGGVIRITRKIGERRLGKIRVRVKTPNCSRLIVGSTKVH